MGNFVVVGATSWGTTLAWLLARNGHSVSLLVRDSDEAARVEARRGIARLPEVVLPSGVVVQARETQAGRFDGYVVAVPAQSFRNACASLSDAKGTPVLSAAKGLEQGSGQRMSEVLMESGWQREAVSALSGPNLAHEIARGLPAAAVVASRSMAMAKTWQSALSGGAFRVYASDDVVGVELGGALKNVIAIAAGAAAGLGFGTNAVAALVTRGLAEITRLGEAMGARPATFLGLAGVGDLAATCFSPLSRNHQLGELLARGATVRAALDEIGETVEGAATASVALELGRAAGVEMPITEQVCAVLEGATTVLEAVTALLGRPLRAEIEPRA